MRAKLEGWSLPPARRTHSKQVPVPSLFCAAALLCFTLSTELCWLTDLLTSTHSCFHFFSHCVCLSLSLPLPFFSLPPSLPHPYPPPLTHTHSHTVHSMHAHYRVTFNSFCRSENSLVSLLISIVWVYRFTGVESERHVFYAPRWQMSCFSSWSGLSLLLWAVLGASTPLIASDRLSQRLQLFSFLWFLCIWCVSLRWDKKKTKCVANCDDSVAVKSVWLLCNCCYFFLPWSGDWNVAVFWGITNS